MRLSVVIRMPAEKIPERWASVPPKHPHCQNAFLEPCLGIVAARCVEEAAVNLRGMTIGEVRVPPAVGVLCFPVVLILGESLLRIVSDGEEVDRGVVFRRGIAVVERVLGLLIEDAF